MTRFEFGGHGDPIPLPEDGLEMFDPDSPNRPPLVLILPHGTIFKQADYSTFGYTHYEVSVIGAGGGEGGGIGIPEPGYGAAGVKPTNMGGAGGGGGLHVVHGNLEDLPDEVEVTVGQAGADGAQGSGGIENEVISWPNKGQGGFPGEYTVIFWEQVLPNLSPYAQAGAPKAPYVRFQYANPDEFDSDPHDSHVLLPQTVGRLPQHTQHRDNGQVLDYYIPVVYATDGEDGEPSRFGDIAVASGGKGGEKTPYRQFVRGYGTIAPGGQGGDGGVGGTDVAGGGAAGGGYGDVDPTSDPYMPRGGPNGSEPIFPVTQPGIGSWDGHIGQGGGGGMGGSLMSF